MSDILFIFWTLSISIFPVFSVVVVFWDEPFDSLISLSFDMSSVIPHTELVDADVFVPFDVVFVVSPSNDARVVFWSSPILSHLSAYSVQMVFPIISK